MMSRPVAFRAADSSEYVAFITEVSSKHPSTLSISMSHDAKVLASSSR
jgi:hypothetical protein